MPKHYQDKLDNEIDEIIEIVTKGCCPKCGYIESLVKTIRATHEALNIVHDLIREQDNERVEQ